MGVDAGEGTSRGHKKLKDWKIGKIGKLRVEMLKGFESCNVIYHLTSNLSRSVDYGLLTVDKNNFLPTL